MCHYGPHIGRRSFALLLAYLLALQVILTAWAVVSPSAASGVAQTVICTTHGEASVPSSGGSPSICPCGPMCTSGGCAGGGEPAQALASVLVFRAAEPTALAPFAESPPQRRVASEPERARAPPVLA